MKNLARTGSRWLNALFALLLLFSTIAHAQPSDKDFPDRFLITRDTFWDFGPPFHYYEILSITPDGRGSKVERVLITPAGDRCLQPPTIEAETVMSDESIEGLLQGKNPCSISEKDLRRERDRKKKSLVFSGANVTMQLSCGAHLRNLRMDILDRDIYSEAPKTPQQTSWTMSVLDQLDRALGPGVPDKPAFNLKDDSSPVNPSDSETVRALRNGQFDSLFGSDTKVSDIYREALAPRQAPSILLKGASPDAPVSFTLPKYPPIARAAHVEGRVTFTLEVSPAGQVTNLSYTGGPKMLWPATADAVNQWQFQPEAAGHHVQASVEFHLNCPRADTKH